MVGLAEDLGVDALGVNHLMYATPDEVDQTLKILGETDRRLIATFVTADPGVSPAAVAAEDVGARRRGAGSGGSASTTGRRSTSRSSRGTTRRARRFAAGACIRSSTRASASAARCTSARSSGSRSATWPCPRSRRCGTTRRYVDLRRRLLERELFPVCRRCCKVELSPEPVPVAARGLERPSHADAHAGGHRSHDWSNDAAHQPAARQRRGLHPAGPVPGARRSARHHQAAVLARSSSRRCSARCGIDFRVIDQTAERSSTESVIERLDAEGVQARADRLLQHDADARLRRRARWRS